MRTTVTILLRSAKAPLHGAVPEQKAELTPINPQLRVLTGPKPIRLAPRPVALLSPIPRLPTPQPPAPPPCSPPARPPLAPQPPVIVIVLPLHVPSQDRS